MRLRLSTIYVGRQSAAVVQGEQKKKPQTKFDLKPPKGTRDFYPEDMRLQRSLSMHPYVTINLHQLSMHRGFQPHPNPKIVI